MKYPSPRRILLCLTVVVTLASLAVGCTADSSVTSSSDEGWELGPATYGQVISDNVQVPMDDGVVLNATVSYPADLATGERSQGKFPVIVNITPYAPDTEPYAGEHGKLFTQHGYIFASVSIRGTQDSGGNMGLFSERDAADGVEIVEWAARKLDGSDGTVGGYGCSYPGMALIATAGMVGQNSPLKAIIPACTGWDNIREMSLVGGIPTGDSVLFDLMAEFVGNQPSAQDTFGAVAHDLRTGGPAAYSEFWQKRQPIGYAKQIVDNDIPTLLWTGWNDVNRRGALEMYAAMQNEAAGVGTTNGPFFSDSASGKYQVVVGPWHHTEGLDPAVMLRWYDTWLKDKATGMDRTEKPMHLYEQGSERWINATSYPLATDYDTFYLASAASLANDIATTSGRETIAWTPPTESDGVLDYTTAPLTSGATLAGPSSVEVFARTNTTNLALIATLLDVAPDGTEIPITFGVVLGSQSALDSDLNWRDSSGNLIRPYTIQSQDTYLKPGQQQLISIPLHPNLWSVEPGHALRMRFTTQPSAQDCEVDGGVGVLLPCRPNDPQRASLAGGVFDIEWSADEPSAVHLPLLPYQCFETSTARATSSSQGAVMPEAWSSSENHC